MTRKLQSSFDAFGIMWPAVKHHLPCMVHVIQLAFVAFMSSLGVKGCTKYCEIQERDQQFGENERTDIGNSQRLWKEGNARISKLSALQPSLGKIIEKVRISRHCEWAEPDIHTVENACCIDYTDTWSSKQVHWLSKSQCTNRSTTSSGCESTVESETVVAWAGLPMRGIQWWVAYESKMQRLLASLHNTEWFNHHQVLHGSFEAIPILDPVVVEMAFCNSVSCHHCLQWHAWSHGLLYVSVG